MTEETKEERLKRKVDETEALRQETVEDIVRTQRTYPHEALALAAEVLRWRREKPVTQAVSEAVPWPNAPFPFLRQQLQGALAAEVEARDEARKWQEAYRKLQEVRRMRETPEPLPLPARHDGHQWLRSTQLSDEDKAKLRAAQADTAPSDEYLRARRDALARNRALYQQIADARELHVQRINEDGSTTECTCRDHHPPHLAHAIYCPLFKD